MKIPFITSYIALYRATNQFHHMRFDRNSIAQTLVKFPISETKGWCEACDFSGKIISVLLTKNWAIKIEC